MKPLLKVSFGFLILIVLLMIWWSSTLIEEDLKRLRAEVVVLQNETHGLNKDLSMKVSQLKLPNQVESTSTHVKRIHMKEEEPNLLVEDPYLTETLPQVLGTHFVPKGIRKEAMIGHPENLHPFNAFKDVSNFHSMCCPSLAQLHCGKFETLAPDLAIKIEERERADLVGAKEYWVHLRENVFWQPLDPTLFPSDFQLADHFLKPHLVTAHDFKFFFDAVMNPYVSDAKAASLRTYFGDIESFVVLDDLTFVVRWKAYPTVEGTFQTKYSALSLTGSLQPLPRFVFQYFADGDKILDEDDDEQTYRNNSIWAQNFSQHWAKNTLVSCGPYLFDGMTDEGIFFKRNPNYHNPYAVLVDRYHITFKESFDAIWQEFKAGNLDICHVSPNQLVELENFMKSSDYKTQVEQGKAIHSLDYIDRCFYYVGWNLQNDFFRSRKVRRALTQAIDRRRIIEQNLNQMAIGITGPFFPYSPAYDTSLQLLPYNKELAGRLLDEEGWIDLDGDGIREKLIDGKRVPFRFRLYYYVKSLSTKVIMDYIATAYRELGIDCRPYGLDITDLSRQFDEKTFDAIFMGWKLGTPPEDPRQIWHSSGAKEKGSSNAIGFVNPRIDTLIEKLNYETDHSTRTHYYHQFHQIIHEQNPYTFLYTPKVRLIYRERVKNLFIPRERQDLIPGADIPEPNLQVIWIDL